MSHRTMTVPQWFMAGALRIPTSLSFATPTRQDQTHPAPAQEQVHSAGLLSLCVLFPGWALLPCKHSPGPAMSCLQAAAGCYNNRGATDSGFHFRTKAGKKEGGPGCLTATLSHTGASPSCQECLSSPPAPSDAVGWGVQAGGLRKM